MMAVTQTGYGSAAVLDVHETDVPEVGEQDVLVRVRAASLNFGDRMVLLGRPTLFRPLAYGMRRPSVPVVGMAAAGVVVAVGSGVTDVRTGDSVFGELARGACAEYVLARPEELARKPEAVRFEEAATLPVAAATALRALRDVAGAGPGHRVLINGASGGAGTFAIQIAKALGAHVTAVCRPRHLDQATALGADEVIDAEAQAYVDSGERFDVVLDFVGNHGLSQRRRVLADQGVYVASFGQGGSALLGPLGRIASVAMAAMFAPARVKLFAAQPDPSDLADVVDMVASAKVRPVIEARFRLSETPEAFRQLLTGSRSGKLVITVDDPFAYAATRSS